MPTNTYTALRTTTTSGLVSSVTFDLTGITGYTDLVLVVSAATTHSSSTFLNMQFNGDTGTNYSATDIFGSGSGSVSSRDANTSSGWLGLNASIDTTLGNSLTVANILNYSNSTTFQTWLCRSSRGNNALDYFGTEALVGLWRNTAPVTSILIRNSRGGTNYNFAIGSTFSLYGISAQGASPTAKATGGDIYADSTYYYHVFDSTGVFTPLSSLSADVLVIAGGGGAGNFYGGGGGAGGLRQLSAQSLSASAYTVTIGGGGTGAGNQSSKGASGVNSSFAGAGITTITATGGGGGGSNSNQAGLSGGSGGGGSITGAAGTGNAGGYSPAEGFAGFSFNASQTSGGGGGAGGAAVGTSGRGDGANGTTAYASWLKATSAGQNILGTYYIAGGGSGSPGDTSLAGFGGGGGRNGLNGYNGAPATGGGGGADAGNGGSGIVIVRYTKA